MKMCSFIFHLVMFLKCSGLKLAAGESNDDCSRLASWRVRVMKQPNQRQVPFEVKKPNNNETPQKTNNANPGSWVARTGLLNWRKTLIYKVF